MSWRRTVGCGIKQLSSVVFDPPVMNAGSEVRVSIDGDILPDVGFTPPAALVRIGFEKHGDSGAHGDSYLCFSRGQVRFVLSTVAMKTNDALPAPRLVFPGSAPGLSNTLLVQSFEKVTSSNAATLRTNTARWAWDGDAFTRIK